MTRMEISFTGGNSCVSEDWYSHYYDERDDSYHEWRGDTEWDFSDNPSNCCDGPATDGGSGGGNGGGGNGNTCACKWTEVSKVLVIDCPPCND